MNSVVGKSAFLCRDEMNSVVGKSTRLVSTAHVKYEVKSGRKADADAVFLRSGIPSYDARELTVCLALWVICGLSSSPFLGFVWAVGCGLLEFIEWQ